MLLEVHQPIGHLQVRDVEDDPGIAEGRGIFAVRVDHHHMAVRRGLADPVEDQGGAGRLAGAGRAEQGEVLAEEGVDIDAGADVLGREHRADLDAGAAVSGVDLAQVLAGRGIDQRAGDRIGGHAAAEAVDAAGQPLLVALAEEIDVGQDAAGNLGILALGPHRGEQPAVADADLDLAADLPGQGDRGVFIARAFLQALEVERDGGAGAGDLQHDADRLAGVVQAVGDAHRGQIVGLRWPRIAETVHAHVRHRPRQPLLVAQDGRELRAGG